MIIKTLNIILFIFFILFAQEKTFCQENIVSPHDLFKHRLIIPSRLAIGFKAGVHYTGMIITDNPEGVYKSKPEVELRPGLHAGLSSEFTLTNKLSLFADISYFDHHTRYIEKTVNYQDVYNERLQLISLPLGTYYYFKRSGIKSHLISGLSISALVNSKLDYQYHPFPDISPYTQHGIIDITFNKNWLNMEAILGVGFRYQVKEYFIGLEIKYFHGLRNFIDTDEMRIIQVYDRNNPPFPYQPPGFRIHGIILDLIIQKPGR